MTPEDLTKPEALARIKEYALEQFTSRSLPYREEELFLARCYMEGLDRYVRSKGYEINITKKKD